jgi:glycine cleavage system aminomethyltransferase T
MAIVCGTGYTGEDGVEILCDPADAPMLWDELVKRGATPAGLAARDTLRLEVCFHLYGNDLMESRGPIEAGLGWCCKEDTGFIGADAIRAARENGTAEKLAPFKLTGPRIARQGNPVVGGGEVTSGTLSPVPGHRDRMAYLPTANATEGHDFEIDVRGKNRSAVVARSRSTASRVPRHGRRFLSRGSPLPPEHDWARIDGETGHAGHHVVRRRTRSARWCSSTRPRSAARSAAASRMPRSSRSRRSRT